MNKIENTNSSVYTLENLFHKYNGYCCPYCTNLPEILNFNETNGEIKFKCKKDGEKTLGIQEYLENMQKYITLSELNTKNKCSEHNNENYTNYCMACDKNICQKCLNEHEEHIKYTIESLSPNNNEILLIKNKLSLYLKEKTELMQKLKLLEDKINFIDTLINSYEKQTPNFYLNINIKHLLYGENINLDEIVKEFKMKSGELEIEMKQKAFEDLIKNNFIEATKGMDKLFLMDKNLGNSLINDIIKGLENSTIFEILKFGNKILNPKEIISIKDIKFLNLRGNKISNIDFLLNKDFGNLEILSLNNNEIESIDIFKEINFPLLRELYLSKNKISSIDSLIELKSKKLQILWLSENNISSIDCLEKMKFPQLRKLGLNKNKIKDINVLIKMKFPQLFELYINDNEFDLDNFYEIIEKLSLKVREFYY
jgi:hypothetical protein